MATTTEATDTDRLRDALTAANVPCLLMVLFQLTGERRWLEAPHTPTPARGMDPHDDGGLPPDVREDVRSAAAAAVLAHEAGRPAAVPAPRGEELLEMLRAFTGEDVPDEYELSMAETLGSASDAPRVPAGPVPDGFSALVVGAGVSGLVATRALHAMGVPVTVLERNTEVGGTWWENRYPGAGVDTPSHLYSFSFRPRDWSTHFGKRDEVAGYLADVADAEDLRRDVRLGVAVSSAVWDDDAARWTVTATGPDGEQQVHHATVLVSGVGQLNEPRLPAIDGIDAFEGPVFHSARWPDDLDVSGRHLAVVGTGASAMQIVPAVAGRAASVTVFQRSPQWIAPNAEYFRSFGDDHRLVMARVPHYRGWYRARLAWTFNDKVHASLRRDPDFEHPERAVNAVNDGHRRFFTRYLESELEDRPDLVAKALPDYPPFGKRMLLDNGWFAALRRDDVELVTEPVAALTPTGVRTTSGLERDADVVVLATGFHAHDFLASIEVRGRSGATLAETWGEDDGWAHLGITVPDFPNLFLLSGPNTALGHGGSQITVIEAQMRYVADVVASMVDRGWRAVEVRAEVAEDYRRRVDDEHAAMIWTHPGMRNWYRNERGRVVSTLPWRIVDYQAMTRTADVDDFHTR